MKPTSPRIRLGLVNDNATSCEAVRRLLVTRPHCQLLWTAYDGVQAVECCKKDPPDIVLMDVIMPRMDGVEATRQILSIATCTVLLMTWSIPHNTSKVFEAMGAGALDVVTTPREGNLEEEAAFFRKLDQVQTLTVTAPEPAKSPVPVSAVPSDRGQRVILLGASAGGPSALASVLKDLSSELPTGVIIAQHMDVRFGDSFVDWLGSQSNWVVRKAMAGDAVENGVVLVASADHHLAFTTGNRLCFTDKPQTSYTPSVDVLFSSAAQHWKGKLAAALLTGMGSDGAKGLKLLRGAGHFTVAQDRATSALFGMPGSAAAMGAAVAVLPLADISARLGGYIVR